jgi:hypothetical protein
LNNKNVISKSIFYWTKNEIETITFFQQVEGDIYPESELPEKMLRRITDYCGRKEQIKSKDDIFLPKKMKKI